MTCGLQETMTGVPANKKLLHKGLDIMVELCEQGFLWSWNDGEEKHVFRLVPNVHGQIKANESYNPKRGFWTTDLHAFQCKEVNAKRENKV